MKAVIRLVAMVSTLVSLGAGASAQQLAAPKDLVNAGKITSYVGGYDYFLEKTGARDDERAALTAG